MQFLNEEIWVRRDLLRPGRPFIWREYLLIDTLRSTTFAVLPITILIQMALLRLGIKSFQSPNPMLVATGYAITICSPFVLISIILLMKAIKTSSRCPTWFYAEQLNPERLRIYHLRKPPTIIKLAQSSLDKKTRLKYYTTLTITDKATETSATLGLLTPEEHDRFMQYWNAAQKTPDE